MMSNAYDIASDVYNFLNVKGRRAGAETIGQHIPASLGDIEAALRDLEANGRVRRVMIRGRSDGISRTMWRAK
jgi:hypothetical protein